MKILVVGGGGREHALAWKIAQSPRVEKIYCAPGNAGTFQTEKCINVSIKADDITTLCKFAEGLDIDMTFVGPEDSLCDGIVNLFDSRGRTIIGPTKGAARLEGSKVFAKEFMLRHEIPTADSLVFDNPVEALVWLRRINKDGELPCFIKANGLAAGKGAIFCGSLEEGERIINEMMVEKKFGSAGEIVLIEELLIGEEATFMVFTDGRMAFPMPSTQDHKPIYDGDQGPNTGGMGAYAPAPVITEILKQEIMDSIVYPTIQGMAKEGNPYRGVLYFGLMITKNGPKVIEYNCRFGDPECQSLMMLLETDIVDIFECLTLDGLDQLNVKWKDGASVCVVMSMDGYPRDYIKGEIISGLDEAAAMKDIMVFHAGTALEGNEVVTNGGRVLGVTALGEDIPRAIESAYQAVKKIHWPEAYYRTDIARKAIGRR